MASTTVTVNLLGLEEVQSIIKKAADALGEVRAVLTEIAAQGCIDPLAGPNPRPDLLQTSPDIERCGKYVTRPDYPVCAACLAEQALDKLKTKVD